MYAKMTFLFKLAILFFAYGDHISVAALPVPTRASSPAARLVFFYHHAKHNIAGQKINSHIFCLLPPPLPQHLHGIRQRHKPTSPGEQASRPFRPSPLEIDWAIVSDYRECCSDAGCLAQCGDDYTGNTIIIHHRYYARVLSGRAWVNLWGNRRRINQHCHHYHYYTSHSFVSDIDDEGEFAEPWQLMCWHKRPVGRDTTPASWQTMAPMCSHSVRGGPFFCQEGEGLGIAHHTVLLTASRPRVWL